jgi:hypothetical protein
MLRAALALLSSLQIGARIKQSFERSVRQASVIAVGVLLLVTAAILSLIAAYHALISVYQFSTVEAAAIMAAGLLLVGLLVIAITPLIGARPKRARTGSTCRNRGGPESHRSECRHSHAAGGSPAANCDCLYGGLLGESQVMHTPLLRPAGNHVASEHADANGKDERRGKVFFHRLFSVTCRVGHEVARATAL